MALLKLGQKVTDFDAEDFIGFVEEKGALTPKQVPMIFWRMRSPGVDYRPTDRKVRSRRDSDISQLRDGTPAAYKRVFAALAPSQRGRIASVEARFREHRQSRR